MGQEIIRITESDLHNIVRESVYQILEQKQSVNEGWKNWAMAGALGAASMFSNPQTANAQNYVFNSLKTPGEAVGEKIDELLLDANKPIKYNYELIKHRLSQHRENKYAKYTIWVKGSYTNKKKQRCNDVSVSMITIKGKDAERYRTIDGQIIHTLTNLYAKSLDEEFKLPNEEFQSCEGADYRLTNVPVATVSSNSGVRGGVYRRERVPQHLVYSLSEYSPTWKKIYNKVIEETGLKDGGTMYDLDYKLGIIDGKNRLFDDGIQSVVEEMPQFPGGSRAMSEYFEKETENNYPVVAEENGVQGRVVCEFVVETDGTISNVKVVKSVDPSLDVAAKRIVQRMPIWIPGKNNGKTVRCKYTVPVTFKLPQ